MLFHPSKAGRQGPSHHMQPRHWVASAVFVALFAVSLTAVRAEGGAGVPFVAAKKAATPNVAPVTDGVYREECGSCHFAYQPGLLTKASWERLMGGLADHFGDNAELTPEVQAQLTAYLRANAADGTSGGTSGSSSSRLSKRIVRAVGAGAPLRIGEVSFIRKEHAEIPRKMLADNEQVKSLSRCEACHRSADEGFYNEHNVDIPGFGRWED